MGRRFFRAVVVFLAAAAADATAQPAPAPEARPAGLVAHEGGAMTED